jgi:hypothetical protein
MWKHIRSGMLLAVLGGAVPAGLTMPTAEAKWFCRGCQNSQRHARNCKCQSQQPAVNCQSQQPVGNYQTPQPVVETQMVPQQMMTYRNEVVTQYRQEAVTQNVPVTTYQNVTVDEGGYQMVYVPKPVTKQVPQVVYQPQTSYRSVPYQVTQQVPQLVTQMVPQQVVRQQPSTMTSAAVSQVPPIAPITTPFFATAPMASGPILPNPFPSHTFPTPCGPCGGGGFAPAPMIPTVQVIGQPMITSPVTAAPVISNPVRMLAPVTATNPTPVQPHMESNSAPVPDPKFLDRPGAAKESWTTVGTRRGSADQSARNGDDDSRTSSNVRFKPARTVYKSWESQSQNAATEAPARQ